MKKVIKILLIIIWMILIYSFSNQNGIASSNMSGGIVDTIIELLEKLGIVFNDKMVDVFGFLIRKIAHFTLYFILGILWLWLLKDYSISFKLQVIYTIIFCVLYACSDEIHQLFVSGRDGKIFDVMIDTLGSLSSCIYIYLFRKIRKTL